MQNPEQQELSMAGVTDFVVVKRKNQKYQIAAIDKDNNVMYNLPVTTFEHAIQQQQTLKDFWKL